MSTENNPIRVFHIYDGARPIFRNNYEFGLNSNGKEEGRIIVFEENNREMVREYSKNDLGKWTCLQCCRIKATENNYAIMDENETFHVPVNHICNPISYIESKEEQNKIKEMVSKISTGLEVELSICSKHKPEDSSNDNLSDNISKCSNVSLRSLSVIGEEGEVETAANGSVSCRDLSSSNLPIKFYHPSAHFLEQCCKQFELDYTHLSYSFWGKIKIDEIAHNFIPDIFHSILNEKSSGFSCLSLYLTGSEGNGDYIKNKLNGFVLDNTNFLGQKIGKNLSASNNPILRECITSINPHQLHLEVFCHLCNCKVFIFAGGIWKQFGETKVNRIPIFLMALQNGKYCPILHLKS
uniref:Uncharacterized protein n=1 Tax=Panagrolaimus sp. ES5 TaxID=591445 RepID=A0AC34F509_9BILA